MFLIQSRLDCCIVSSYIKYEVTRYDVTDSKKVCYQINFQNIDQFSKFFR